VLEENGLLAEEKKSEPILAPKSNRFARHMSVRKDIGWRAGSVGGGEGKKEGSRRVDGHGISSGEHRQGALQGNVTEQRK